MSFVTFITIGKTEGICEIKTYSESTENINSGITNLLSNVDKSLQYIAGNPNISLATSLFDSSVSDDQYTT